MTQLSGKAVLAPAALAAALAAALSIATPEIMRWEGKRNDPYRDIVGVMTVCYGETQAPMRRYSDAECSAMLARRVERDFARPILACIPGFAARPHAFAAAISLSYNIGTSGFCRSTAAARFKKGDWRGGCEAMLAWNRAGGKVVPGLVRRREAERRLCLHSAT
ncbi:MAG: lysozyme [Sphingobium sp.]